MTLLLDLGILGHVATATKNKGLAMKKEIKNPHQIAQIKAIQFLRDKYRAEYTAVYRAEVVAAGGKVHPSHAERVARLKEQLAELEASK